MNPMAILLPVAQAAPAAPGMGTFLLPIALIAVMYFLIIRPQMKRQKEHKAMLEKISKGDEVLTSGGLIGRIDEIGEQFVVLEIAAGVTVKMQKQAISAVLPKGTLKGV